MIEQIIQSAETRILSATVASQLGSPDECFGAAARMLLRVRADYAAEIESELDPMSFEGLRLMDYLDHLLLERWLDVVRTYLQSFDYRAVNGELPPDVRALADGLPEYPAPFMIIGFVFYLHDKVAPKNGSSLPMLGITAGVVERYLDLRRRPVKRHHSCVAQEYTVVSRMRCPGCKRLNALHVTSQKLQLGQRVARDCLALRCRACGHETSVSFDLPYFADLKSQI